MGDKLKLPVGIENFEEILADSYYYIDKTKLIEQLFDSRGKVNLFTRPRRFGKTLNMSMLKCFFEIGTAPSLFDGLYISGNRQVCEEHMGKYPVIFLSLKNVEGLTFESAKYHDYNMLMVLCVFTGIFVIAGNVIGQSVSEWIDPRMKEIKMTGKADMV